MAVGYQAAEVTAPTSDQLTAVLHTISQWVANFLARRGILERNEDNSYLTLDGLDEDPAVIEKILKHLKEKTVTDSTAQRPPS